MSYSKGILYSSSDIKISQLKELIVDQNILSDSDQNMYNKALIWCQENDVLAFFWDENNYHFKFSLIYSAPYIVYAKWNIDLLNKNICAMVWPRKYSPYANQVMESLFVHLWEYDVVTISGLADGVDKMCHEMSLQSNIPTIAVLGGWLKHYMSWRDRELIQKIIDHGWLVLSEFKLNSKPERYTFPQRNRIVAGLSDMVFLPEASEKSGSLITVDFARQMHKDVYGTPNSIFSSTSQWLHQYMQQWLITPVVNWEWMLGKYFWKKINDFQPKISDLQDSIFESDTSILIEVLQKNSSWLSLQSLIAHTGLGVEEVMSQLSIAEVLGQVRNDAGLWKIK